MKRLIELLILLLLTICSVQSPALAQWHGNGGGGSGGTGYGSGTKVLTANYTANSNDGTLTWDGTTNITLTMPPSPTLGEKHAVVITGAPGSNVLTVTPNTGQQMANVFGANGIQLGEINYDFTAIQILEFAHGTWVLENANEVYDGPLITSGFYLAPQNTNDLTIHVSPQNLTANRTMTIPDADSVVPQADAGVTHQFFKALNGTTGAFTKAQPAASDITGLAASATTDTTNAANISSGTLPAGRLPNPSASTLGGVESLAAVSHNFLTSISTAGVPAQAQPDISDITTTGNGHNALVGNSGGSAITGVAPGTSGNVLTSNGTDWTSAAPTAPSLTKIAMQETILHITPTQWKAIHTTPQQIVAAPGSTSTIIPISYSLQYAYAGTPYASGGNVQLLWGVGGTDPFASDLASTSYTQSASATSFIQMGTAGQTFSPNTSCVNKPLVVTTTASDPANGTSDIYVGVTYYVMGSPDLSALAAFTIVPFSRRRRARAQLKRCA